MKLEYKRFDFDKTLSDIDSVLQPECNELMPKNAFVNCIEDDTVCAYASIIAVYVRTKVTDGTKLEVLQRSYELSRDIILNIFRDNTDCIDVICMGRYFIGIFNTPVNTYINNVIVTMAKISSALSVLDIKLHKRFNINIEGNCGCDYGRLFRLQTSVSRDKNWKTWHGSALNLAMSFAEQAIIDNKNGIIISETIKLNLTEEFAGFFPTYDSQLGGYRNTLGDSQMLKWINENK